MKHLKQIIGVALSVSMLLGGIVSADTGITNDASYEEKIVISEKEEINEQGITDFVTRLYELALQRDPDSAGIDAWKSVLRDRKATGISVAYGFIYSSEFQGRDISNDDYVELMYQMFFGRESDAEGKAGWLNVINSMDRDAGRQNVFDGFANSVEFYNLCQSYGVVAGTYVPGAYVDGVAKINLFVERFYETVLGRTCDKQGMADWTNSLMSGSQTGIATAQGFFYSSEYTSRNRTDNEYIEDLYQAFMGREPDEAGRAAWASDLAGGDFRANVFRGFALSTEFSKICNDYGITVGELPAIDYYDYIGEVTYLTSRGDRFYDTTGQADWWNVATTGDTLNASATYSSNPGAIQLAMRTEDKNLGAVEYIYYRIPDPNNFASAHEVFRATIQPTEYPWVDGGGYNYYYDCTYAGTIADGLYMIEVYYNNVIQVRSYCVVGTI